METKVQSFYLKCSEYLNSPFSDLVIAISFMGKLQEDMRVFVEEEKTKNNKDLVPISISHFLFSDILVTTVVFQCA